MELFISHESVEFDISNDWIAPERLSSNNLTCHVEERLAYKLQQCSFLQIWTTPETKPGLSIE